MTDETKTYLVNVESNLKRYADEAAEAKKKVDDLKAANDNLKKSGTATASEIEANNAALRNAQQEYKKAKSMVDAHVTALNSETGSRKQLSSILKIQEQELGKLGNAFIKNAQGLDILNPKYTEQRNRIAATKQAIIDYDQALNDGRSNIGRYGESIDTAFKQAGQSIMSMVSPMALVTAGIALGKKVFDGLKEAIMSTTGALNFFNTTTQITKQIFYELVTTGEISMESMVKAAEAAKLMNEQRIGDRDDMVQFAKLEKEIAILEFNASDKTKLRAERQDALDKAIETQNKLSDLKIADAKEDLRITQELIQIRPKDDKLRQQEAVIIAKTFSLDKERFEQTKRNNARLSQFVLDEEKQWDDWHKKLQEAADEEIKKNEENYEKRKQLSDDLAKLLQSEKDEVNELIRKSKEQMDEEVKKHFAVKKLKTDELRFNKDIAASNLRLADQNKKINQAEIEQQEWKIDVTKNALATLSKIVDEQTEAGKGFAVAAATIDTWQAANKALAAGPPPWNFIMMGTVIAAGLLNVANILKVNTKAKTGAASPSAISSTPPTQKAYASQVGSTVLTQPALTQTQLNVLPNQNLMTAEDIANAIKNLPAPIVTVEDFNAKVKEFNKVSVRANI